MTARSRRGAPPLNTDGSTLDPAPAACGPYRILHQIGAGSLGPVFRAHDPAESRLVALKIFRLDITPAQVTALAGRLEQLAADQPHHPAIATALAAGVEGACAYLAQEFAAGEALDAYLRHHGPPPVDLTLRVLGQLAEALDRAAGEGIHHGALHPRDVLVDASGDATLIDLGVAQALQQAGLQAPVRRPYSAPERVDGDAWGGAADIYALGAIAYELVTGRRVAGPGIPAAAAPPGAAGFDEQAFADVLGRALAADPAARFASASDLIDLLRPVLARSRRSAGSRRRNRITPDAPALPLDPSEEVVEAAADLPLTLPATPLAGMPLGEEIAEALGPPAPAPESTGPFDGPAWTAPASPRSSLFPLTIALLLGLAGGFGLGYWTAWRTAVREGPHVLAGTAVPPPETRPEPAGPVQIAEPEVKGEGNAPIAPAPKPHPPAARPRPTPPPGQLLVRSTPSGARVRVDGHVRGHTPLILRDLPLRVMMVAIDHEGYKPDERRVALSATRPTVTVEARLAPEAPPAPVVTTGTVVVESRPAGAHVFFDGQDVGVTPLSLPAVPPGTHRIRLQMAGFNPWVTTTEVTAGARTRVAASLEQGQP